MGARRPGAGIPPGAGGPLRLVEPTNPGPEFLTAKAPRTPGLEGAHRGAKRNLEGGMPLRSQSGHLLGKNRILGGLGAPTETPLVPAVKFFLGSGLNL